MATENNLIIQAIKFLEKAPYRERKPYLEDYIRGRRLGKGYGKNTEGKR